MAAGLLVFNASKQGIADSDTTRIRQLVLMPVAVGKLSSAGVPRRNLNRLSGALNRARVNPGSFNIILRTAVTHENLGGVNPLGNFVRRKLKQGLVGSEVTVAVRDHLNAEYDVAWDFLERVNPTPLSPRFIPDAVRARIKKRHIQGRESGASSSRPDWRNSPAPTYLRSNDSMSGRGRDRR